MVTWFKHDIPAWMDGTEGLSDGAYRTYHVVLQLIYLNEGPIALNEHGIAGRCRQSVRAFRRCLQELIEAGKLSMDSGRISNQRAKKEIEKVGENRMNAAKGGINSGEARKSPTNPLENNNLVEASLQDSRSLREKTRLDQTREDETGARAGELRREIVLAYEAANSTMLPDTSRANLWLAQGYDSTIILATIKTTLARKPEISNLAYFENAIRDAHAKKAPAVTAPKPILWDGVCDHFVKHGRWIAPTPEPGLPGCQCPVDILKAHGIDASTGQIIGVAA